MWMSMLIPASLLLATGTLALADTFRLRPSAGAITYPHPRACGDGVRWELQQIINREPRIKVTPDQIYLRATPILVAAHRSVVVGESAMGFWDVRPGRVIAASVRPSPQGPRATLSIIHRGPDPLTEGMADACYETWEGEAEVVTQPAGDQP